MTRFQHNTDGQIIIEGPAGFYFDTVANFALDYGAAYVGLPAGMQAVVYVQGGMFAAFENGNQHACTVSSATYDAYIAALPNILTAQHNRLNPPATTGTTTTAPAV